MFGIAGKAPILALLLSSALAGAQAPSRMDDLVERFMAIVDRTAPAETEPFSPPGRRDELLGLNPGRAQDVDRLVGETAACLHRTITEAMPRLARSAARGLGEERLARLVAFLEGPGGAAIDSGGSLTDAQAEEWSRIREDYGEFMYSVPRYMDPPVTSAFTRCTDEEAASAARLGLRME